LDIAHPVHLLKTQHYGDSVSIFSWGEEIGIPVC